MDCDGDVDCVPVDCDGDVDCDMECGLWCGISCVPWTVMWDSLCTSSLLNTLSVVLGKAQPALPDCKD